MGKKCKCKKQSGGGDIPEWVVTFGDMMSLLLCFFILLAAFSELKKEHEYQRVITAVKEAFGYSGGVGVMPTDDPPMRSMIELLENIAAQQAQQTKVSQAQDRGIKGKQTKVSRVHDGLMFTVGGSLTFEPLSAELKPEAKEELRKIANLMRGRNNKVAVRGHASTKVIPPGSPFKDLRDLSYYRAKAVAEFLVTEGGLREERIVLDARGDTEPVAVRRYSDAGQAENRRVEVIMLEVMMDELHADPNGTSEALSRDG
ncbi:MAG: OmpA family protein [Phycisphaerales bacterium]